MPKSQKGYKVWLVTWEWIGDHARVDDKIVAILSPRLSAKQVQRIVNVLHQSAKYTLQEQIEILARKRRNPYPAEFDRIGGVPWEGRLICGHNPFLLARLVDGFTVESSGGKEAATWKERSRPRPMKR